MGSTVWTDEESQYIKAMLNWKEKPEPLDSARSSRVIGSAPETAIAKQPVGEFRILVIGAKGVGKTSIITRVTQAFLVVYFKLIFLRLAVTSVCLTLCRTVLYGYPSSQARPLLRGWLPSSL